MNFAESFNSGFNNGVQLGVRAVERKQDRGRYEEDMKLRRNADERAATRAEQETEQYNRGKAEYDANEAVKTAKTLHSAGYMFAEAGDIKTATPIAEKLYNQYSNGKEAKIIDTTDPNLDPRLRDTISKDPKMNGKKILVRTVDKNTGEQGFMPFDDIKGVFDFVAPHLDPKTFTEARRQSEQALATAKAAAKPVKTEKGWMIDDYELTPGGVIKKIGQVPYTGPAPLTDAEEKIEIAKKELGKKYSPETAAIILGLKDKVPNEAPSKALAKEQDAVIRAAKIERIEDTKTQKKLERHLKLFSEEEVTDDETLTKRKKTREEVALEVASGKRQATSPEQLAAAKGIRAILNNQVGSEAKKSGTRKARDPKGNIWELDETGKPLRIVTAAKESAASPKAENAQLADAPIVPGYSPRSWRNMTQTEKKAAYDKWRSQRKQQSRQGLTAAQ